MPTISVFHFETGQLDGAEVYGTFETQDFGEACEYAQRLGLRVIEDEYEFADSNLIISYVRGEHPDGTLVEDNEEVDA